MNCSQNGESRLKQRDESFELFHSDRKDDNNFYGFNSVVHNLGDVNLLIYMSLMDFVPRNDQEFDADLEADWSRVDPPPWNIPFTREEKLNAKMEDYEPLSFLNYFLMI